MPNYTFQCKQCLKEFDELCLSHDNLAVVKCPHCGSTEHDIAYHGANIGIKFQGSGFYQTDYKDKGS